MKVGIVVPFSWSFWGAVLEHAELKSEALRKRGHDVKIMIGNDPPGHVHARAPPAARPPRRPAAGRDPGRPHGDRPRERLAAEHRAQPAVTFRLKRIFAEERFDVLHLHEPMTPAICVSTLARREVPDRRDLARGRRAQLDALRPARSGGSCWTGSTTGSPSPTRRARRRSGGSRGWSSR